MKKNSRSKLEKIMIILLVGSISMLILYLLIGVIFSALNAQLPQWWATLGVFIFAVVWGVVWAIPFLDADGYIDITKI